MSIFAVAVAIPHLLWAFLQMKQRSAPLQLLTVNINSEGHLHINADPVSVTFADTEQSH